jgi:hypothetical protein
MFQFVYNTMHETLWNRTAVGKAAPAGHPAVKSGQKSVGSGTGLKCICKLSVSLVADISSKRFQRATPQAHPRSSSQAIQVSEESAGKVAPKGSSNCGLSDRPMDLKAHRQSDRRGVWGSISPLPHLEASGHPGMEVSETRASSIAEERRRNCPLEAVPLAPYKKRPKDLGPIWSSSMNPGSCLSPTSPVPGHPKGRPLSFITSISKTEFLPSVVSRCPLKEDVWPFISGFAHAISQGWMFGVSLRACSNTSGDQWFCCGTEEPSIGGRRSSNFFSVIRDCTFITFPLTHRNSIRQNMFGVRPTVPSPIVRRRTLQISKDCSKIPCVGYEAPRSSFGLVSMLPIYHGYGKIESFHYLCKIQ